MSSMRAVNILIVPPQFRLCLRLHGAFFGTGAHTKSRILTIPLSQNFSTDARKHRSEPSVSCSNAALLSSLPRRNFYGRRTILTHGANRTSLTAQKATGAEIPAWSFHWNAARSFSTSGSKNQETAAVSPFLVDSQSPPSAEAAFVVPEPPPVPTPLPDGGELVLHEGTSDLAALGLGGWWPPGLFQQFLDLMHSTGLPWWAAIAVATLCLRTLIFPLTIKAQRSTAVLQQKMPEVQALQMKMTEARLQGDVMGATMASHELQVLMREGGFNPFKSMLPIMAQAPVFLSVFIGLRRMANAPVESMKEGGMLWFTDLTVPDPYYILPIMTSVTLLAVIELAAESGGGGAAVNPNQTAVMKMVMRFVPLIMLPFIAKFPAALLCYWFTSNAISLGQVYVLKQPAVRRLFKLPPLVKHKPESLPMKKKGIRESMRELSSTDGNLPHPEGRVQSLPQVLVINPKHSLIFKGPSSQSATVTITLTNPSARTVAFKVKTTAPKRYCVRPNGGVIKAGETVSVNIVYQPGDGNNNDAQERARHKFLVQGIFVENDLVQLDQVWRDMPKDRVMESKIRCVFEDSDENVAPEKLPDGRKTDIEGADMDLSMRNTATAALTATHSDRDAGGGIDSKELELRRMAEDYRRAQDEIANLRDENRRLRENGERLRRSLQSTTGSVSSLSGGKGSHQDLASDWKSDLTKIPILVTIVGALVLGIIVSQILF